MGITARVSGAGFPRLVQPGPRPDSRSPVCVARRMPLCRKVPCAPASPCSTWTYDRPGSASGASERRFEPRVYTLCRRHGTVVPCRPSSTGGRQFCFDRVGGGPLKSDQTWVSSPVEISTDELVGPHFRCVRDAAPGAVSPGRAGADPSRRDLARCSYKVQLARRVHRRIVVGIHCCGR